MNAVVREPVTAAQQLVLLGTGTVGAAFVRRYQQLQTRGLAVPALAWLANSRAARRCAGELETVLEQVRRAPAAADPRVALAATTPLRAGDVVVDATASDAVAGRHAGGLQAGIHVVTANKLGTGAQLQRAEQIVACGAASSARYGDSATVGAGLPLLSSLRSLVAGGDRIHTIEGVLSGSLAWLFHRYDGQRPFSDAVREALAAGFTEPDPRVDLSGEDVRRKLLILARASGLALDAAQVQVQSLVPPALVALPLAQALEQLSCIDAPLRQQWRHARDEGKVLRFVGRVDRTGAQVGLRALPMDHPLAQGAGTDNRVVIHSDRYATQPLQVQGPGAGAEITAAALLDDVLRIVETAARPIR